MKKFFAVAAIALAAGSLGACQTQGERAGGGALLGGVAGAAIGGAATGKVGGAVAGGIIGAAGGAILGAATADCADGYRPRTDRYGNTLYTRDGRVICGPDRGRQVYSY